MKIRDPKIDPQEDDVLEKHGVRVLTRTVIGRNGNDVKYSNSAGRTFTCWITTWREWAKDAKAVKIAQQPPESGHPAAPDLAGY